MKAITIYNSLSQKLEPFEPFAPPQVSMYCCGPTVYGLLHVGNFRGAVFYNFLRNWLEFSGYKVKFVYNFTDVDDKIIDRAKQEGVDPQALAEKYIQEFWTDFNKLGLRPHDVNPKVTESMDVITSTVEHLIQKGHAYNTDTGDVYFEVRSFEEYGKLSNRKIEDLKKSERTEPDGRKKDMLDFALWKAAKPGEPAWPSPWGQGRPGWHIECSAMIRKHLGDQIDIHGGGLDLLFPHHENEVAQSEGACGKKPFAKYWVHNNLIQFGGSKMSKSLGNIISARDFLSQYHPEIFKYLVLSVHYRSVLDLGEESISNAIKGLARIYSALNMAHEFLEAEVAPAPKSTFEDTVAKIKKQIVDDANKDFNTALVISHLFEAVRAFNQKVRRGLKVTPDIAKMSLLLVDLFKEVGPLLSLFNEHPAQFLTFLDDHLLLEKKLSRSDIQIKVDQRAALRADKKFAEADQVRAELDAMGIAVSDLASGKCYWEVAK